MEPRSGLTRRNALTPGNYILWFQARVVRHLCAVSRRRQQRGKSRNIPLSNLRQKLFNHTVLDFGWEIGIST